MLCDYCQDPIAIAAVTVIVRNQMRQFCGLSCAVSYLEELCGRYRKSAGLAGRD